MAALEDALGNRWKDFEVEDMSEVAFLRLLEHLLYTARYRNDAYGVYGCLPMNEHGVGKCGTVNGNEG